MSAEIFNFQIKLGISERMIYNLSEQNSVVHPFLRELRDKHLQYDRMRFRKNMERLGEIMAYEISKVLSYGKETIETPLAKMEVRVLAEQPVLFTILRAGLVYFQGFLNYFDKADCGFIGAYRKEGAGEVTINLEYLASSSLTNKTMIMIDPMLATGRSVIRSINTLLKNGTPAHVHIAALVAAPEGIQYIKDNLKIPHTIWTCAIDETLNHQFYIVPGLGDAGYLSFGDKL